MYVYLTENLLILFTRKIVSKSSGKSNKMSGFHSKQNNNKNTLSMFPTNWFYVTVLFIQSTLQGPVVQSRGSLTSSLRDQLVKCLRLYSQIH